MRVYEFSKQYNIPAKDVITTLRAEGFDIKSHDKPHDKSEKSDTIKQINEKPVSVVSSAKKEISAGDKKTVDQKVDAGTVILKEMSVADFAHKTGIPVSDIILTLLN